jgi:hypothetical protein
MSAGDHHRRREGNILGVEAASRLGVRVACHRFPCAPKSSTHGGWITRFGPPKRQLRSAAPPHSKTLARTLSPGARLSESRLATSIFSTRNGPKAHLILCGLQNQFEATRLREPRSRHE